MKKREELNIVKWTKQEAEILESAIHEINGASENSHIHEEKKAYIRSIKKHIIKKNAEKIKGFNYGYIGNIADPRKRLFLIQTLDAIECFNPEQNDNWISIKKELLKEAGLSTKELSLLKHRDSHKILDKSRIKLIMPEKGRTIDIQYHNPSPILIKPWS